MNNSSENTSHHHILKNNKSAGIFLAMLALLLLCGAVAKAGPVEIWITPTGGGAGSGTPDDPFSTPDPDSFFNLMNDQRVINSTNYIIPEYSTVHLMPGTFHVREGYNSAGAARSPITMKCGWKVRGAGMDVTVLQLVTNSTALFGKIFVISSTAVTTGRSWDTWGTPLVDADISDMTIDCNLQNQSTPQCIQAISIGGTHNKISRVKSINWGSMVSGAECFVFILGPHGNLPANEPLDGLIEDCVVTQPAQVTHLCDSIACCACGAPGDTRPASWKIRGCVVRDIVGGTGVGQPDGFSAYGAGNDTEVTDSTAYNLSGTAQAAYADTVVYHNMTYRNNQFLNVASGIIYNGSDNHVTNVTLIDNIITSTNPAGSGISLYMPQYSMRGIRIEGNIIRPAVQGASMGAALAINSVNGAMIFSADNNVLDAGNGMDFFVNSYQYTNFQAISFKNNVNLRGEPLNLGGFPDLTWTLKGFYEEEYSFTPTNSGWYKILLPDSGKSGTRLEFWSPLTHLNVGIDFSREIGGTSLGQLTMLYNDSDNVSSTISSVRLAHYDTLGSDENSKFGPFSSDSVDAYISASQVGYPVNIRISGMNRPSILGGWGGPKFVPYPPQTSPANTLQLDIGPGIRTTGPIYAGLSGGSVQQITDSAGHIQATALNMVQPAQGGLGQNASGVVANRFPYTTATGTFGFGSLTSYTLSLLNSPDAATAQSTLQLVPGTQVQAHSSKLDAMVSSPTTSTEFGYLSGVTSSIQTQLNTLASSTPQKIYKTADQSIGSTAANATDLSFPVAANTDYGFEFTIVVTNSAAGSGYQLALNGPSGPLELTAKMEVPVSNGTLGGAGTAYGVTSYGTFIGPGSNGPGVNRVIATIYGTLRNGANAGTFTVQAQAGGSSTVTIKRGSWGTYWKLN